MQKKKKKVDISINNIRYNKINIESVEYRSRKIVKDQLTVGLAMIRSRDNRSGSGSGNGNGNGDGENTINDNTDGNNINNPYRYSVFQSHYNNISRLYEKQMASIKTLSLNHLTAKQHMLLALFRDISLIPAGFHWFKAIRKAYLISAKDIFNNNIDLSNINNNLKINEIKILSNLITGRASEYVLCSLWCLVSLYLSFAILDNLMVRWIMKYSVMAVILRMFSMSLVLITIQLFLLNSLSPERDYFLHTWILISCILTGLFIWQNYLTSNLDYINRTPHPQHTHHFYPNQRHNQHLMNDPVNAPNKPSILSVSSSSSSSMTPIESTTAERNNDNLEENLVEDDSEDILRSHTINYEDNDSDLNNEETTRKNVRSLARSQTNIKRAFDIYNIIVFCVVPIGLASFITMLCLLRNLFIQRLDIEQLIDLLNIDI